MFPAQQQVFHADLKENGGWFRKLHGHTQGKFCSSVYPFPGNMDRHHYEMFTRFGDNGFLLHLDNARG